MEAQGIMERDNQGDMMMKTTPEAAADYENEKNARTADVQNIRIEAAELAIKLPRKAWRVCSHSRDTPTER
jgi:hypothetical protein